MFQVPVPGAPGGANDGLPAAGFSALLTPGAKLRRFFLNLHYEQTEAFHRMAGIRGVLGDRGEDGYCHFPDQNLVYLYLFPDHGFAADHLLCPGILDEYQTIYPFGSQESCEISLTSRGCGFFCILPR
jgi:hypothetical protein